MGSGNQVLNTEQKKAVCSVLTNVLNLGTTGNRKDIQGILVENFFSKDELIVLLKLCKVLGKKAVKEGFILRRGKIDLKELNDDWGDYINLDSIGKKI